MKAVYLFNFLKFVEWPDKQFDNGTSPFILVLLGDDPFGNVLDEAIGSEKVGNHPIIVKRIHSLKNLDFCHALFVTSSVREDLDEIFMRVGESPILTISDISNFADRGGAIGVYEENSRIRFSINLHTMKRADLKASSKLLRLARVIDPL